MKTTLIALAVGITLALITGTPGSALAQAEVDTKTVGKALKIKLTPDQKAAIARAAERGREQVQIEVTAEQAGALRKQFEVAPTGNLTITVDPGHVVEGDNILIDSTVSGLQSIKR